ncbi:MAG TPA: glycosyltransferase family 2 protein [Candidatus Acidoferrum sp.]|nr:glycosyltransferase family 2 protein [Candidatus Acidoferrum sp.]
MISVIIPAHNESVVIARTLRAITDGAAAGELDVIVVCNGCTDDTASVARCFDPSVRVIETDIASKTRALNLGDEVAQCFPRVYVDADVVITVEAIRILTRRLERSELLVVAPTPRFDLSGCSWPVRACFHVRSLLPSAHEGIGGSGVYALSEAGRRRFREFPAVTADDGYVRIQFRLEERETLRSVNSTVFPPRTTKDLIAQKTRAHYGSFELARLFPGLWENRGESNHESLMRLFRDPRLWCKLAVYCLVTAISKYRAKNRLGKPLTWDRDNTSRASA